MRSRDYVTVGCPCVCLSHHSTAAVAGGGFAAGRRAGGTYRSIDSSGRRCTAANAGRVDSRVHEAEHRPAMVKVWS